MIELIVTRHQALIALAIERGLVTAETPVSAHVTPDVLRGKHVFGVLPLDLAVHAASVTTIPLSLRPEDRGRELSLDETRERAGATRRFRVEEF